MQSERLGESCSVDTFPHEEFSVLVKHYRCARGLTQEELAERAKISVDSISNIERGLLHTPRSSTLQQLALALTLAPHERDDFLSAAHRAKAASRKARLLRTARHASETASSLIPLPPAPLVGRHQDLKSARAILSDPRVRLLTITGVGGVGKTQFAFELAREMGTTVTEGVHIVYLAPIHDPALVPAAIAEVLGLHETGATSIAELLVQHLREKNALLLLDNFEHVLAASTSVADILAVSPHLKILATSRSPLHLRGEYDYGLLPLEIPSATHVSSNERLIAIPSVALFVQRAHAVRPDFVLNSENAEHVAAICQLLDGLPLAIELAAARSRILSPYALLAKLESSRLSTLVDGARDLPARQQTLRNTLAWSYDLLAPKAQTLFRRLAVFAGGCTLEAAEAVSACMGAPFTDSDDKLDTLAMLVDQSLLRHRSDEADKTSRFELLETVREFSWELLKASGEVETVLRAHACWFLELSTHAEEGMRGQNATMWLKRLDAERDNLRATLTWALNGGDLALGLHLAPALWRYWYMRGYFAEGRQWLESLLEASERQAAGTIPGPSHEELARTAKILYGIGSMARPQGDLTSARTALERSLALCEQLGDKQQIAYVCNALGAVEQQEGNMSLALALFEKSLTIKRDLHDQRGIANTLTSLGLLYLDEKDFEKAASTCEECIAISEALGNSETAAWGKATLAQVHLYRGNLGQAAALAGESLALRRQLGDKRGVMQALGVLGEIKHKRGDISGAVKLYRQSLRLAHDMGVAEGIIEALVAIATACRDVLLPQIATRLLAATSAFRKSAGVGAHAGMEEGEQHLIDDLGAMQGSPDYGAAWDDGESMTLESALTLALNWSIPPRVAEAANPRAFKDATRR